MHYIGIDIISEQQYRFRSDKCLRNRYSMKQSDSQQPDIYRPGWDVLVVNIFDFDVIADVRGENTSDPMYYM